jgi:ubiquinone/menaquinone biosynthesis C-methylase UbiE
MTSLRPAPGTATSFDSQAAEFERRVGLSEAVCREVAASVLELSGVRPGDLMVEIGAGTGMIGRWFAAYPVRYVGIDLSRGMLEVFRRREAARPAMLVQADAGRPWPLPDGRARAVFSSRAIHLLPPELVADELSRTVTPTGGASVVGWVERRRDSVKSRLAREMRRRLRERGFEPRTAGAKEVVAACGRRGADALERKVVVTWPAVHSPRRALDDWRAKEGLGGSVLPPGVQGEVLRELEAWAVAAFGDLDAEIETEESYVLEGARWGGEEPAEE